MQKRYILPLAIVALLLINLPALADEVRVFASISERTLQVGELMTLSIEVVGATKADVTDFEIPGCQIQYYGPSVQMSSINGQTTKSITLRYRVMPYQAGTFTVPAIPVEVGRKTYTTEPVDFTAIVDDSTSTNGYTGNAGNTGNGGNTASGNGSNNYSGTNGGNGYNGGTGNSGVSGSNGSTTAGTSSNSGAGGIENQLNEYVFLEVVPARERVYPNEEIPVTIRLYYRSDIELSDIHYPEIKANNFLVGKFPEPERRGELVNGMYYYVIPFETTLTAISSGTYQLNDIHVKANVLLPNQQRRSLFDPSYQAYELNLQAPSRTIRVLDFPKAGKPADFTGAVGRFQMAVTVTPEDVKPGEPITVRTQFTGNGNFDTVKAPALEKSSQFKFYDPQDVTGTTQDGTPQQEKIFEQVLIPTKDADIIPEIRFSYFDPVEEKYYTLTHGPTPLHMQGGSTATAADQVVDYRQGPKTAEVLGQDILYIKSTPGRFVTIGQGALANPGLIGYNLALVLALGGSVFWQMRRERISPIERKRRAALAQTQQMLNESESFLHAKQTSEFYNTLYTAVQTYLKERFEIAITGITTYEHGQLLNAGVPEQLIQEIKDFYRQIDEKRFAGAFGTTAEMEQMLTRARAIVQQIEKGGVA